MIPTAAGLRWRAASKGVLGTPARRSRRSSSVPWGCSPRMRCRACRRRGAGASARGTGPTTARPSSCAPTICPGSCRGVLWRILTRAQGMRPLRRRTGRGRASRPGTGASPRTPPSRGAHASTTGATTAKYGVVASPRPRGTAHGATLWMGRIAEDRGSRTSTRGVTGISARSRRRGATGSPCSPPAGSSWTAAPCPTPLSPRTAASAAASGSWGTGRTWPASAAAWSCPRSTPSNTSTPIWGPAGRMSTTHCARWWRARSAKELSGCPGIRRMSGLISARSRRRATQDATAGTGGATKVSPTRAARTQPTLPTRSGATFTSGTALGRRSPGKGPGATGRSARRSGRIRSAVRRCGTSPRFPWCPRPRMDVTAWVTGPTTGCSTISAPPRPGGPRGALLRTPLRALGTARWAASRTRHGTSVRPRRRRYRDAPASTTGGTRARCSTAARRRRRVEASGVT
mmetsp:Transcript_10311/g.26201  ORF Transcript_10311/g.26201 Transcript_10311/m.26201 type:complete len:460 (-) Transcript_10311:4041-5420(-)